MRNPIRSAIIRRAFWLFSGVILFCALIEGLALLSPVGLLDYTPIVFFGKVVDDKGAPVSDAVVRISYGDLMGDSLMPGYTQETKTTDSLGRF